LSGPITKEDIAREALAINKLRTETPALHIVRIFRHDWLVSSSRGGAGLPVYYIDMELGRGNLEDYIKYRFLNDPACIPTFRIWQIMQQVAAGVKFIHQYGVIHRDLKPANGKFLFFVKRIFT
jgi:serine/threonine protein kinase